MIMDKAARNINRFLSGHMVSFFFSKYFGVELLDSIVYLSFQAILFISFSCFTVLAMTSNVLHKRGEKGRLCLIPDPNGKASFSPLSTMLAVMFLYVYKVKDIFVDS